MIDLKGKAFGRLRVERRSTAPHCSRAVYWVCRCECGNTIDTRGDNLRRGKTKSCGCLSAELSTKRRTQLRHGRTRTPEYRIWAAVKNRCQNPRVKGYERYGGRGIAVCARWQRFDEFFADMGIRPSPAHSIERRENDGDYEPGNCVWATRHQQARNTSRTRNLTLNGEAKCLSDWAASLGMTPSALFKRIERWGSLERALTAPKRR